MEIEEKTNLAKITIRTSLHEMANIGIARKVKGGWVLGSVQLSELEEQYNCAEASQKRANRIRKERKDDLERRQAYSPKQVEKAVNQWFNKKFHKDDDGEYVIPSKKGIQSRPLSPRKDRCN